MEKQDKNDHDGGQDGHTNHDARGGDGHETKDRTVDVTVVYASAVDHYRNKHASRLLTIGELKKAVLEFFHLIEGSRPDGTVATYTLYHGKSALENLNQTLGDVVGHEDKVKLKLGEQITQGDDKLPATASDIAFEDDLLELERAEDMARWKAARGDPQEVFVTLASAAEPTNLYEVRFAWRSYPLDAPSMKFRNPATKSLTDPKAWPIVRGFRPGNLDACVNWCEEGFVTHPEWRADPKFRWRAEGNALLRVLRILQSELDDHYSGRFAG